MFRKVNANVNFASLRRYAVIVNQTSRFRSMPVSQQSTR